MCAVATESPLAGAAHSVTEQGIPWCALASAIAVSIIEGDNSIALT
jgi:hypothetical protein